MKIEKKDVILFWLRRHEREIEARVAPPDQTVLAKQGLTYTARIQAAKDAEERANSTTVQLESIRAAIRYIEENG